MCGGMLVHGYNTRQIRKSLKNDKIVAVLGIEGGEALNGNLAVLHALYRLGVRFLGLTWNQRNQIADGVGEALTGGGLTKFGREVVREMNNLGMLFHTFRKLVFGMFWLIHGIQLWSLMPIVIPFKTISGI